MRRHSNTAHVLKNALKLTWTICNRCSQEIQKPQEPLHKTTARWATDHILNVWSWGYHARTSNDEVLLRMVHLLEADALFILNSAEDGHGRSESRESDSWLSRWALWGSFFFECKKLFKTYTFSKARKCEVWGENFILTSPGSRRSTDLDMLVCMFIYIYI